MCNNTQKKLCNEDCEICFNRSFASHHKSEFWSSLNNKTPREVCKGIDKKFLFNCSECHHIFETTLGRINTGVWCNFCSNKQLCEEKNCTICFNKSFASHPKSQFWSDLNEKLPREIFKNSNKKYLFHCDKCTHTFETVVASINKGRQWCNYCSNTYLCEEENCIICFNKSFASHSKSEFWSNLNQKTPRGVFKGTDKKYIFHCNKCNHKFESSLDHINSGTWCPYCSNNILCNDNNCVICLNKSFASHSKSEFWSGLNRETPRQVFKGSGNKYLFNCIECTHIFESRLSDINNKKSWCSYCSSTLLCNDNNCLNCFNKSFASHPKSKFWSNLNKELPRQIFKNSNNKFFFNCNKCNHSFETTLGNINNNKSWCSYCSNKLLCKEETCNLCFNRSFASHLKSKFWSSLNKLTPRGVFKSSNKKYFFDCNECNHSFESSVGNINTGTWCPKCVNKTELIIYNYLLELYTRIDREVTFFWCEKKRFDFIILDLNLIIELDGNGHFQQVSNWGSHEDTRLNDIYKMKCAFNNGYSIIRIQQAFVFANKLDWKSMLNNYIKLYENPTVIFIGDTRYHQHIMDTNFTENTITHLI